MYNATDLQQLRKNGLTNKQILEQMAPVVPSAAKALAAIKSDTKTPAWQLDIKIGQMLDKGTPKNAPSGMAYMNAINLNKAQKKFDAYEQQTKQEPSLFSKAVDYLNAPGDAATGLINKGLSKLNIPGLSDLAGKTQEVQQLPENLRQAGDTLGVAIPVAAGIATGGASLPVMAGVDFAAGAAGSLVNNALGAAGGEDKTLKDFTVDPLVSGGVNAAAGAALGLAGKGIKKGVEAIADTGPGRLINSLIKPAQGEFKFGKNPGKAIADEGIVATSADDLLQKVSTRAEEIGKNIEQSIISQSKTAATQIDMKPLITGPIDEQLKVLKKLPTVNASAINTLEGLKQDLLSNYGNTQVELGVWNAKKEVGNLINWNSNEPFRDEVNKALWKVFEGLKTTLNKSVPGLEQLNGRYSELIAAAKSIERRSGVAQRANIIGNVGSLGGAALGYQQDGARGAAVGALGMKALGTTVGKTVAAQGVKALSKPAKALVEQISKFGAQEKSAILGAIQSLLQNEE